MDAKRHHTTTVQLLSTQGTHRRRCMPVTTKRRGKSHKATNKLREDNINRAKRRNGRGTQGGDQGRLLYSNLNYRKQATPITTDTAGTSRGTLETALSVMKEDRSE